jgi:hypothetical protein
MSKPLKIFRVLLLICCCLFLRQTTFARQNADSTNQPEKSLNDYSKVDTAAAPVSVNETEENNDAKALEEERAFNENNFDKATTQPLPIKRDLNNPEWNRITKDPAFHYEKQASPKATPPKDYSNSWWARMFQALFAFLGSRIGLILILLIVVAIVVALIIRAIQLNGNVFFSKKDKQVGQNEDTEAEDYIPENWELEIAAAAKTGNYRLALRHCYRYLLTTLQEKELIRFQMAKTNYQYVYELAGTEYHKSFMKLTRDYEYAWYGGFEINKDFYETYYQMTRNIQQQLKP